MVLKESMPGLHGIAPLTSCINVEQVKVVAVQRNNFLLSKGRRLRRSLFCRICAENATIPARNQLMVCLQRDFNEGTKMRALIICAIIITASIGLTGCFHHSQAVTQEPLKLG